MRISYLISAFSSSLLNLAVSFHSFSTDITNEFVCAPRCVSINLRYFINFHVYTSIKAKFSKLTKFQSDNEQEIYHSSPWLVFAIRHSAFFIFAKIQTLYC